MSKFVFRLNLYFGREMLKEGSRSGEIKASLSGVYGAEPHIEVRQPAMRFSYIS